MSLIETQRARKKIFQEDHIETLFIYESGIVSAFSILIMVQTKIGVKDF